MYQATDSKLGRSVAIKILPELFARDAERVARMEREARTLALLNHPHIAAIYGLEESGASLSENRIGAFFQPRRRRRSGVCSSAACKRIGIGASKARTRFASKSKRCSPNRNRSKPRRLRRLSGSVFRGSLQQCLYQESLCSRFPHYDTCVKPLPRRHSNFAPTSSRRLQPTQPRLLFLRTGGRSYLQPPATDSSAFGCGNSTKPQRSRWPGPKEPRILSGRRIASPLASSIARE